ncbi:MAG: sulfite exporter TauE/SafE family protein [Pyrinomonadaceae bacterium]
MRELLLQITATSTFALLGYGFLLGLKHATEADHLVAVSTIVSGRRSIWSSAVVGGLWGLGHTISLIIAGVFVLLLDFEISENTERWLEFCVGIMLTLLGLNVLRKLVSGGQIHFHTHEHGEHLHAHPHVHDHSEVKNPEIAHKKGHSPRALFIGLVHGLAGSAALMLLVIKTIPSKNVGFLYIIVFGVGSIGGMMLMSFFVGLPFLFKASRFNRFNQVLQTVAGCISVALGLWIMYEKGFKAGLSA